MRALVSALCAVAIVTGSPSLLTGDGLQHAQAQEPADRLPSGRLGVRAGVRGGSGLYDFGFGFTTAVVAGYQPTRRDQYVALGAEWAAAWSFFEFADAISITGSIRLLEFEAGARLRVRPSLAASRFIVIGAGLCLMRTSVPIVPDGKRSYLGPYISLGLEPKVGEFTLGFDFRYSLLAFGPRTITLGVTVSVGK